MTFLIAIILVCLLNACYPPNTSLTSWMATSVLCGCYYHPPLQVSKLGLSARPGPQPGNAGAQSWAMVYPQRPRSFDCVTTIHHSSIYGSFISSLFSGGKYQWYLSHISMINIRGIIPVSTQTLLHSSELTHHFRSTQISNTSCFPVILTSCRGEKVVGIFTPEDIGAAYLHIIHTVVHLERLQTILVEKENSRLHTHG